MGIGLFFGQVSQWQDYFNWPQKNQFVIAWWLSILLLIGFFNYWILFQGGAEALVKYPGFLRFQIKHPQPLKLGAMFSLIIMIIVSFVIFYML
jgi:hypothetical protein